MPADQATKKGQASQNHEKSGLENGMKRKNALTCETKKEYLYLVLQLQETNRWTKPNTQRPTSRETKNNNLLRNFYFNLCNPQR
jgi:hypothetical protein